MSTRCAAQRIGAIAVAALALLLVGCSNDEPAASQDTSVAPSSTAVASPNPQSTTQPRPSCAADSLGAVVAASFEAPTLTDVVCEQAFAMATLSNGPDGEFVVLFRLEGGVWVLSTSAPIAEAASVAPPDFSPTAVPTWQRTREARLVREANPRTPGQSQSTNPTWTQVNRESGLLEVCEQQGADFSYCAPPTTPAPADPEDPDAPESPPVTSNFCRYNYNDPRCVESGQQFEPPRRG